MSDTGRRGPGPAKGGRQDRPCSGWRAPTGAAEAPPRRPGNRVTTPSNLRRYFARLAERAGLGRWHPNELRHIAASLLSAAGVPLEHVADVLGHDGTRMTALVYRHAVAPTVAAAVSPMERMFSA